MNLVDPDGLAPFAVVVVGVAEGGPIIYRIYKTFRAAKKAAHLLKKGGKLDLILVIKVVLPTFITS
jgi:hypothetical protein